MLCGTVPTVAASSSALDQERLALSMLDASRCDAPTLHRVVVAQQVEVSPSPSASPSAAPTPTIPRAPSGVRQLYPTIATSPGVTPPPVPSPTPAPDTSNAPIYVVRGGPTPPPIPNAGTAPQQVPHPSDAPTLAPGTIAVISDELLGNKDLSKAQDAIGNVHIFYSNGELVGDRAHFDGIRTVTVTGHPFLINRARDSVLEADSIVFDTIDQTAVLEHGVGTSNEGVDRGRVHFRADDLHTDPDGTGHGTNAFLSTCENARAGYHLTGKTLTYYPGDKIVISKVVLWLGAAAVFYLPRVVIPLRTIDDETQRPQFFPEMGYDQAEGFWVKMRLAFGKDKYYYGYYRVDYFTKVGLGLGYVGFYTKKNGKRQVQINYYGIKDKRSDTSTKNLTVSETENFSNSLRGQFGFAYQSAFGALTDQPPTTNVNGSIIHTGKSTQNYTFRRDATGTQNESDAFGVTDTRTLWKIQQNESLTFTRTSTNFGVASNVSQATFQSQSALTTPGAAYVMTFLRQFTNTPTGYWKLPELTIRPTGLFKNIGVPVSSNFTIGDYSEPQTPFATTRAEGVFNVGPALYRVFGGDLSLSENVRQDIYATGDMKAAITQNVSYNSQFGSHVINSISYSEANFAGPAFLPFQNLDTQGTINTKQATDTLRIFNQDYYNLSIGFVVPFKPQAQAVTYLLNARPTSRALVQLGGALIPGTGFSSTNVILATPLGRDYWLQFSGDIDWKRQNSWLINKNIYLTKLIGDCYDVRVLYNQSSKQISVSLDILAFPSRSLGFGFGGPVGSVIPSTFNF